jgi:hypothetical protein
MPHPAAPSILAASPTRPSPTTTMSWRETHAGTEGREGSKTPGASGVVAVAGHESAWTGRSGTGRREGGGMDLARGGWREVEDSWGGEDSMRAEGGGA